LRLRHRSGDEDLDIASDKSETDNTPKGHGKGRKAASVSSDASSQKMYFLVFQNSPVPSLVNTKLPVDFEASGTISVGRDPTSSIVILDPDVSRHHAEFSMVGTRVMLKDLQSTNGTYVHDGKDFQQVKGSAPVKLKTLIKFGTSTIVQLTRETETQYEH
jgi:pSer/pThr/pTyr-binding forkhead associated (FHA) protein